jgi:flavin reductase (DIM6/NTAB) family NADH-FMN oxidoreductase RutF
MTLDAAHFRQIFGHFATGVTVITTAVDGWLHGMTANAVTSVSLDPLLLLVCVDKTAHAHKQLAKAGRFGVNILADEQEGVSRIFAATAEPEQGQLQGAAYHFGRQGTPVLDGCLAYLECEVSQQVDAGDHTIFLGRVLDGEIERESPPLLFYRGGYRQLDS